MKSWYAASLSLFFLLVPQVLEAAACCSGGGSLPAIILNDDRWSARLTSSMSFVVGESNADGESIWRDDALGEQMMSFVPSGVYRLSPYWQMGARVSLKQRSLFEESRWGLGDAQVNLSYEPFPLFTYHPWRPRLLLIGGLGIPLGKSPYEVNDSRLSSFSAGFFEPFIGALFARTFNPWDFLVSLETRFPWERGFERERVDPGMTMSAKLGAGYSTSWMRFGMMLGPAYQQKKSFKNSNRAQPEKLVWDFQVDLSRSFSETWSWTFAYQDQTLLGPAKNVQLERGASLGIQYHGL